MGSYYSEVSIFSVSSRALSVIHQESQFLFFPWRQIFHAIQNRLPKATTARNTACYGGCPAARGRASNVEQSGIRVGYGDSSVTTQTWDREVGSPTRELSDI